MKSFTNYAAQGDFFVLTRSPVALCPFCDSDKDWPADIIVGILDRSQFFTSTPLPSIQTEFTPSLNSPDLESSP